MIAVVEEQMPFPLAEMPYAVYSRFLMLLTSKNRSATELTNKELYKQCSTFMGIEVHVQTGKDRHTNTWRCIPGGKIVFACSSLSLYAVPDGPLKKFECYFNFTELCVRGSLIDGSMSSFRFRTVTVVKQLTDDKLDNIILHLYHDELSTLKIMVPPSASRAKSLWKRCITAMPSIKHYEVRYDKKLETIEDDLIIPDAVLTMTIKTGTITHELVRELDPVKISFKKTSA